MDNGVTGVVAEDSISPGDRLTCTPPYSGRDEKLSGFATTLNVPGRWKDAFLSRESSSPSILNGGMLSRLEVPGVNGSREILAE